MNQMIHLSIFLLQIDPSANNQIPCTKTENNKNSLDRFMDILVPNLISNSGSQINVSLHTPRPFIFLIKHKEHIIQVWMSKGFFYIIIIIVIRRNIIIKIVKKESKKGKKNIGWRRN